MNAAVRLLCAAAGAVVGFLGPGAAVASPWALALSAAAAPVPAPLSDVPAPWATLPISVTLSGERLALPAGERMGLLGGSLLFEVSPGWWAGPAVYGAATGERAGLFVGGFELQRRVRLADRLVGAVGLYAGGGGGGAAPVGDGLLVRPAATLMWDFGGWQAGVSASGARFAGTQVGGTQLGLQLAWDGRYRHVDPVWAGRALAELKANLEARDQVTVLMASTAK